MNALKRTITEAIKGEYPDRVKDLESMTHDQWVAYYRLIHSYTTGSRSSDGWSWTIESAMLKAGVKPQLAFTLALMRDRGAFALLMS